MYYVQDAKNVAISMHGFTYLYQITYMDNYFMSFGLYGKMIFKLNF